MNADTRQDDLCFMPISDSARLIASREISPVELTSTVLDRINTHNDELRAYITITSEVALKQARAAEVEIGEGRYRGPLHGIPVSLKDIIMTKGIRTSCASLDNPHWVPDRDATAYEKLRQAGAILVGKANLREYAFASVNPNFPPPINPWHRDRTSGGSSSGSAVAVATGIGHASLGTDTGGSGRSPATQNGVVGLKATYGRVSRAGVFPLSYSLDHTTVMTRTVRDSAIVLNAVSGFDPRDENSAREPVPEFCEKLGRSIKGMRIGIASGFSNKTVDAEVAMLTSRAIGVLEDLGAETLELDLPYVAQCLPVYQPIITAEAATVHYRTLRETPEKLGPDVRSQLDLGSLVPATMYLQAQRVRKVMRDAFREVFETFDVIVGPALAGRPGPAGKFTTYIDGQEVDDRLVNPEYTGIYNLTGLPALAAPSGFASDGTPIGIQIAGAWFDEATVFQVAHAYEQATEWHRQRPPIPTASA